MNTSPFVKSWFVMIHALTHTRTHIDESGVNGYKLAGPTGPEEGQGPECFDFSPVRPCRGGGRGEINSFTRPGIPSRRLWAPIHKRFPVEPYPGPKCRITSSHHTEGLFQYPPTYACVSPATCFLQVVQLKFRLQDAC